LIRIVPVGQARFPGKVEGGGKPVFQQIKIKLGEIIGDYLLTCGRKISFKAGSPEVQAKIRPVSGQVKLVGTVIAGGQAEVILIFP